MATLGQLKATIADDLARSDLSNQIGAAISDAIKHYETERFWFNDSRSITFSTVASQVNYGATANSLIPNLVRIDAVQFYQGTTQIFELSRYDPVEFEYISLTGASGKPTCFTYAPDTTDGEMQIRLWPTPNDVYTMRVHGVYKLAALTDDGTSNAWTTDAYEMIRAAAKARIHLNITHDNESAATMQIAAQGFLERLRQETSSRTGLGRLQPTEF